MSWEMTLTLIVGGVGIGMFFGCILGLLMAGWARSSE